MQERAARPINGQKLCEYSHARFGWRRMGHNGCGILALYNALLLTGQEVSVEHLLERVNRPWKPRCFGMRPRSVEHCLRKLSVPYIRAYSAKELEILLQGGGVGIVLRWNRHLPCYDFTFAPWAEPAYFLANPFGGGHAMAVSHDGFGNWTVYNRYSNRAQSYHYRDFMDFMECEAAYIAGWAFSEFTQEKD